MYHPGAYGIVDMMGPNLRTACFGGTLLLATALPCAGQEGSTSLLEWRPEAGPGPTVVEARAATAGSLLRPPLTVSILSRYSEFQRDFDGDFGVRGLGGDGGEDVLRDLQAKLDERWGDAAVYRWIQGALALYARFQASTQFRQKGFDMEVEMEDVADGKLGVRVQRSLE